MERILIVIDDEIKLELLKLKKDILILEKDVQGLANFISELGEVKDLHTDVKTIKEIIELWNDGTGFIHILNKLSVVISFLVKVVLIISAGYAAFKIFIASTIEEIFK